MATEYEEPLVHQLKEIILTASVKSILPRTDMFATSSLENLKHTSLNTSCLNQSHLLENQRLREVDPTGVVFIETLRSFEPRIADNVGTNFSVGERMRVRRHERKKREVARSATLVVDDLFIKLPSLQHLHNSSTENTVLDTINDNSEKALCSTINNNSKKLCKQPPPPSMENV